MSTEQSFLSLPFGVQWRKALVSLPRLVPDALLSKINPDGPPPLVCTIPSRSKHTIPLYIFIPPNLPNPSDGKSLLKLPVLIDFHGGGFVLGSCQEQSFFCGKMCRELNCISISVDYRMGPTSQFPAAYEDAEDVLSSILDPSFPGYSPLRNTINTHISKSHSSQSSIDIDPDRIAISGFSSGGNLALNLAMSIPATPPLCPDSWPSLIPTSHPVSVPLLLFFPALDTTLLPSERPRPNALPPPKGFLSNLQLETTLMPTYLPKHLATHPRASPIFAPIAVTDSTGLHGKAKVFLVLPELDSMSAFSQRWIDKVDGEGRGADLEVQQVRGVMHGWTQFPDGWLKERDVKLKMAVFEKCRDFIERAWEGREDVARGREVLGDDTGDGEKEKETEEEEEGAKAGLRDGVRQKVDDAVQNK